MTDYDSIAPRLEVDNATIERISYDPETGEFSVEGTVKPNGGFDITFESQ